MADPSGPTKSPDGRYWWDGKAWQPIATLPAPASSSPSPADAGGTTTPEQEGWPAWLPRNPHSEAVLDDALAQEALPPLPHRPAPARPTAPTEPRLRRPSPIVQLVRLNPAWIPKDPRMLVLGGAALVLLIGIGITVGALGNFGQGSAHPAPSGSSRPQATPSGSLSAQADSLVNKSLSPAVAAVIRTQAPVDANCGSYSARCRDSLLATNLELQNVLTIINRGPVPACIGDPTRKVQASAQTMDDGVKLALSGFLGNNQDTIGAGLRSYGAASPGLRSSMDALSASVKSACAG